MRRGQEGVVQSLTVLFPAGKILAQGSTGSPKIYTHQNNIPLSSISKGPVLVVRKPELLVSGKLRIRNPKRVNSWQRGTQDVGASTPYAGCILCDSG